MTRLDASLLYWSFYMSSIQRPPEAAMQLFHRNASQIPLGATLFVEPQDCVVFVHYGAVLGVVPPGTYAIHPHALPMIARAASGPVLEAEVWFVRTVALHGLRMGGSLGAFLDPLTQVECSQRMMAEYTLVASDPARLVVACIGGGPALESVERLVSYVNSVVLRKATELLGHWVMSEGTSMSQQLELQKRLLEQLPAALGELEISGLRVPSLGSVTLALPQEDADRLKRATVEAAQRQRARTLSCTRCGTAHPGGRFCVECGGALAAG